VPADSGSGRRVVFDMTHQRVWLVGRHAGHDVVRRTYLVSGSVTDNLQPGSYTVYSKSMDAVGIDDSGTMHYMVRFAHGANAAIGFHDIPVWNGAKVETRDDLGTAQSHGCIRQWRPDARALWRFTSVGSKVVVVA
jgi:lipoprotein-anchoring transpeptidase ErfK/SrfK